MLPEPHLDEIAVYDGRQRLGYVVQQAAEWLAADDADQVIGRYPTERAAVQAIVTNARRVR